MKKKNRKHNRTETGRQILPADPAAELEAFLKSRLDTLPFRKLIRDQCVTENKSSGSLAVTIVPEGEIVTFGTINIDRKSTRLNSSHSV